MMRKIFILLLVCPSLYANSIVSQRITPNEVYIQASDGREFYMTRQDVFDHYQSLNGSAASRRAATVQWVKDSIIAALGEEQIDPLSIDFNVDGQFNPSVLRFFND